MDEWVKREAVRRKTLGDQRDIATVAAEVQAELDALAPPAPGPDDVVTVNRQRLPDGIERIVTVKGDGSEHVVEGRWK
jgi:hypothetical protein